jgi:DNA-binding transcriptional LysR family regulator
LKNATIRQLRVFSAVARHLSFARAAEALHLSPPAVTMQVKELEADLGMPLFERRGRRIALTTSGEYMLVYARRILATLKDAEDAAARLQRVQSGRLTVGMVRTAKFFLPALLSRFLAEHRGVDLRLAVGNREELVSLLQASEVDIAVMGRPPSEMSTRSEPFAAHPHVFVAAPSHPLAGQRGLAPEALREHDFLVREPGSGTRAAMEAFLQQARLAPRYRMELPSNELIKQAVIANLGMSFLSLHTVGMELRHGQLVVLDVAGTPVVRAWNVVHTLSKLLSPAAEAFRYFVLEHAEAMLAAQFSGIGHLPTAAPAASDRGRRAPRRAPAAPR